MTRKKKDRHAKDLGKASVDLDTSGPNGVPRDEKTIEVLFFSSPSTFE